MEYCILAFVFVPNLVQVMFCAEQPFQISPPLGEVTVMTGLAMVNTLLVPKVVGTDVSLTLIRQVLEGVFGTVHE